MSPQLAQPRALHCFLGIRPTAHCGTWFDGTLFISCLHPSVTAPPPSRRSGTSHAAQTSCPPSRVKVSVCKTQTKRALMLQRRGKVRDLPSFFFLAKHSLFCNSVASHCIPFGP